MLKNTVETHRIFSEEEIEYLRREIDRKESQPDKRWINIKRIFKTELIDNPYIVNHFVGKIIKHSKAITGKDYQLHAVFFLEYHPGGEADLHTDQHAVENKGITIVTIVDQIDMVGGKMLLAEPSEEDHTKIYHDEIITVEPKVGDSVFYKADVIHGVTKVESGYRQVMVTWLDPKKP